VSTPAGHVPKRLGRPPSGRPEAILSATLLLLRERGIARLTTREIAEQAGTSEATIFYHYRDRAGLLEAVFARGLEPLRALSRGGIEGDDHAAVLRHLGEAIEHFLDQSLPVLVAAQSDTQLRDALATYMATHDLGPHRGIQTLSAYLRAEQKADRIRPDADADVLALMFIGSSFLRVFQRQLTGSDRSLPSLHATADALDTLLRPARRRGG